MKKIIIKITDDSVILDGENIETLTEKDIVDSVKMLVSLARIMNVSRKRGPSNGDAQVYS